MKKALIALLIGVPILVIGSLFGYVLYHGPRMKEQLHIRAFQTVAPLPPEGTVTVQVPEELPSPERAALVKSPVPANPANVARGKVYYEYYCIFCHGDGGGGNGPVGESYMPVPSDLRTPKVQGYRDGELLRAMLTGVGHEPVLARVVPPGHRWFVVLYVRSLKPRG